MQIWESDKKGDDKIIAFFNQTIYKANPAPGEVDSYIFKLKMNSIPEAKALEIPLNYIKEITFQEGKNYFDVQFGSNSNEHFIVSDEGRKKEIFGAFEKALPVESTVINYSKIRSARKPLIAMVIVGLIFLWTFFLAIGVENGTDYEVAGSYRSIAGIVLVLAYLGVKKVILIFGLLMIIALISFLKKFNNPPTVHILKVKR